MANEQEDPAAPSSSLEPFEAAAASRKNRLRKIFSGFLLVLVLFVGLDAFYTTPAGYKRLQTTSPAEYKPMDRLRKKLLPGFTNTSTALAGLNELFPPGEARKCPFKTTRFDPPEVQLGDFVRADGGDQAILLGDSVMGQLCLLGLPGLCCNSRVLCPSTTKPLTITDDPRDLNAWVRRYATSTPQWQHLDEFVARGAEDERPAYVPVYHLAPNGLTYPDGGAQAIRDFLYNNNNSDALSPQFELTSGDVLIAGLFGNHFHEKDLPKYKTFVDSLIKEVVNPFPGRVILLGYSPQHFVGEGEYHKSSAFLGCGPFDLFSGIGSTVGLIELRSALWSNAIFENLHHPRTRFIDTNQFLSLLWMCHRYPEGENPDCTHWNDTVYSVLALAVLEALASLG